MKVVNHHESNNALRRVFLGLILVSVTISAVIIQSKPAAANSYYASVEQDCSWLAAQLDNPYGEDGTVSHAILTPIGGGSTFNVPPGATTIKVEVRGSVSLCRDHATRGGVYIATTQQDMNQIRETTANRLVSPNINFPSVTKAKGERVKQRMSVIGTLGVSGFRQGDNRICINHAIKNSVDVWWTSPTVPSCYTIRVNFVKAWSVTEKQAYAIRTTPGSVKRGTTITDARVGERYEFRYEWQNDGPDSTGSVNFLRDYDYPAASQTWAQFGTTKSNVGNGADVFNGTAGNTGFIPANAAGREYCMQTGVQPPAWNISARREGRRICVKVPYNYNLTPSIADLSGVTSVGATLPDVVPRVNNAVTGGRATNSAPVRWELWRVEIPPGATIPIATENNLAPCAYYQPSTACEDKGSGTQVFEPDLTGLPRVQNETVNANTPVGTRICYTLSVRPYTQASTYWRHSTPECVTVSKLPKVQIWGHDLRTRGDIETGTTMINAGGNKLFGSWVEYGGFSVGGNSGFASGSGLNEGNSNTTTADTWNRLTFANVNNSGASDYGRYTLPAGLPTITGQFIGAPSGGGFSSNLGAMPGGTYAVGNVTINTSDVGQENGVGKSIIIVSSGTVTINGNITYRGPGAGDSFTSVDQLPQVVIVARNINITNAATQVDAWLLTTGNGAINTCSDRGLSEPLTSKVCNARLTVNGPVATDHLHLRRTAGSDNAADAGSPAELFNLRPDTYLWAYGRASQAGKAQTVYSVELPPRF